MGCHIFCLWGISFVGEAVGEFKGSDEAGLLVQAAEVTDKVDDSVLFLEGFIGQGVIEVIKALFDLVRIVGAHVLVLGIVQQPQDTNTIPPSAVYTVDQPPLKSSSIFDFKVIMTI